MNAWIAAEWGLLGGMCVEALALHSLIRSSPDWSWRMPIPQGLAAYVISVVARVGAAAGLAAAATSSGQVSGPFAAFGLGVAAPLVVEKLSRAIPLTGTLTVDGRPATTKGAPGIPAERRQLEDANPGLADTGGTSDAR